MCDPLTIASAAATAGSAVTGYMGKQRANNAVRGVLQGSLTNQRGHRNSALGRIYKTTDRFGREVQDDERDRIVGERTSFLKAGNRSSTATSTPFTRSANSVVSNAAKRADTKTTTRSGQRAVRLAKLGTPGQQNFEDRIALNRNRDFVDRTGNFARGDLSVVPFQVKHAQRAGSELRLFSDILGAAGQLGGNLGFMGKGPSFGKLGSLFLSGGPNLDAAGRILGGI